MGWPPVVEWFHKRTFVNEIGPFGTQIWACFGSPSAMKCRHGVPSSWAESRLTRKVNAMTQADGATDPAPPTPAPPPPPPPPPTVTTEPWVDPWSEQSLRGSGSWEVETRPLQGVVRPPEGDE